MTTFNIPAGWKIDRQPTGELIINGPQAGVVVRADAKEPRMIPEEVLFMLASAMLAAAPLVDAVVGEPVALSDMALSYLNPYEIGYGAQTWAEGFRACERSFLATTAVGEPVARDDIALFIEPLSRARIEGNELIATFSSKLRAIGAREFCHAMAQALATPAVSRAEGLEPVGKVELLAGMVMLELAKGVEVANGQSLYAIAPAAPAEPVPVEAVSEDTKLLDALKLAHMALKAS